MKKTESFEVALEKVYNFIYEEIKKTGVNRLDWDIHAEIDLTVSNVYNMSPIRTLRIDKGDITMNEIYDVRRKIETYMNETLAKFRKTKKVKIKIFRPHDRENYPERLRIEVIKVETYEKNNNGIFNKTA